MSRGPQPASAVGHLRLGGALAFVVTLAAAFALTGCAHGNSNRSPSSGARSGYGNAAGLLAAGTPGVHLWWPLTAPEAAAVSGLPAAAGGDYRALLALAILASGDVRDAEGIARIQRRIDQFLAEVRPIVAQAPDLWHRGYELHRAMHRSFFTGGGELAGYEATQPRLTRVFTTGRYNCLSSAVLYVVLARAFELPVRAVAVPTHVFVELGTPGMSPIEVETTSSRGFGLVHDRRFFAEQAAAWSAERGLPPLSFEDYQRREILTPVRLMALAMRNTLPGASEDDQLRLAEMAAVVEPDNPEMQRNRLQVYGVEANRLRDQQAWPTVVRFVDVIAPALTELAARLRDTDIRQSVAWLRWYRGEALMKVGRVEEALAVFEGGVGAIEPGWPDAAALRNNYWALLNERLVTLLEGKAYAEAERLVVRHLDGCRAESTCGPNAGVVYVNWAAERHNAGDWPGARQTLQTCLAHLPAESRCRELLDQLDSRRGP